jgi:hypothetical protein
VVRVVTPGTITEDGLLDARSNNYLAALAEAGGEAGLAWLDLSLDLLLRTNSKTAHGDGVAYTRSSSASHRRITFLTVIIFSL